MYKGMTEEQFKRLEGTMFLNDDIRKTKRKPQMFMTREGLAEFKKIMDENFIKEITGESKDNN